MLIIKVRTINLKAKYYIIFIIVYSYLLLKDILPVIYGYRVVMSVQSMNQSLNTKKRK